MAKDKEKVENTTDDSRKAKWEAWLEAARAQRPDPTIFDMQRANGEFDTIPDWIQ